MLRTVISSATRAVVISSRSRPSQTITRTLRPVCHQFTRHESSQPQHPLSEEELRKRARERNDDLQRDWDARVLSYEQVKPKTLSPSPDAYIIDVREPDEVIQGSIPSSVNLPLSVLGNSLHLTREAFKEKHGFEKPRRNQEIIFYCRSGKRSATASDVAKRNGYTNIYNYEGSWLDWVEREGKKAS